MHNVGAYEIEFDLKKGQMVAMSYNSAQRFNYFLFRTVFSLYVFNPIFYH